MNPQHSLQDVIRCDLCETPVPPKHCDICHIHLCEACVGKHLSVESKDHYIVPFKLRGSTLKCTTHSTKYCKLHCKPCNIPVCPLCASSPEHDQHKKDDILTLLNSKKELIQKDLHDLEEGIYPKYQQSASNLKKKRDDLEHNSKKIKTIINKQGESLKKQIDDIIKNMHNEIDELDSQNMAALDERESEINDTINEIRKVMKKLNILLDSNLIYVVSKYKSRNEEFWRLHTKCQVTQPTFTPQMINRKQICQQIGSLSNYRLFTDIQTDHNLIRNMSFRNDSEFWTCGDDKIMRLYNLQRELVKSVATKSGNDPWDISVSETGDLVYVDSNDGSINLVTDTQIQRLITLKDWRPLALSCSSSGDLLVTMNSDNDKQSKVVRYSGPTVKESFQLDDQGIPLYSTGHIKYITENRNSDICVADHGANAVVVICAAGKLRFRYTGLPFTTTKKQFNPYSIATDRQGMILISDCWNCLIHIVDQDGEFKGYIDNGRVAVFALCVDSRDILYVAECNRGIVKIFQHQ